MKFKTMSALAGTAAFLAAGSAQAAPTIGAIVDTTSAFLVNNNLMSARIIITGWDPGSTIQGFLGTVANPWTVRTGDGSGFFNINTTLSTGGSPLFSDGFYAASFNNAALNAANPGAPFDSGLLGGPGNNPAPANFGSPSDGDGTDDVAGFATFAFGGSNDVNIDPMAWITLNSAGIAPPASLNVLRITWSRNTDATVSFLLAMNTPAGDIPMSINLGIPARGSLALLGLAGLVGGRRRRA